MTEKTVESLQVELDAALEQISNLRKESATSRVARNAALRESHALRTITKAHNVEVDESLTETALGSLQIVNGKVEGDFSYTAPKLKTETKREVKADTTKPMALTEDVIKNMSTDEINKRWDEVSEFMSA